MAVAYACQACGLALDWQVDTCPNCRQQGCITVVGQRRADQPSQSGHASPNHGATSSLVRIGTQGPRSTRVSTGIEEYDRFFGGDGLVLGSTVSVYGEPGCGKSTLALQLGAALDSHGQGPVLYLAAEELSEEVNERAIRLGITGHEGFWIQATGDYSVLERVVAELDPTIIFVDSAQALRCDDLDRGTAGSPIHLRELGLRLIALAKNPERRRVVVTLGHVTNEGDMAGTAFFRHIGDVIVELRREPGMELRRLRLDKNRYGPTSESMLLHMTATGLQTVAPGALIADRVDTPGAVVLAAQEGSRTLFLLVQGMVGELRESGNPRRIVVGVEPARVGIVAAVLDAYTTHRVGARDVLLQVAGGASTEDAAVDLSMALALVSSEMRVPIPRDVIAFGEIGLGGDVRPVCQMDERLAEAARFGFRRALVPRSKSMRTVPNLEIIGLVGIIDMCRWIEDLKEVRTRDRIGSSRRGRMADDGNGDAPTTDGHDSETGRVSGEPAR